MHYLWYLYGIFGNYFTNFGDIAFDDTLILSSNSLMVFCRVDMVLSWFTTKSLIIGIADPVDDCIKLSALLIICSSWGLNEY